MHSIKSRENKIRRHLALGGLRLHKSRTRSSITQNGVPNVRIDDRGGYMIVDETANCIASGENFSMTLEEVNRFAAETWAEKQADEWEEAKRQEWKERAGNEIADCDNENERIRFMEKQDKLCSEWIAEHRPDVQRSFFEKVFEAV